MASTTGEGRVAQAYTQAGNEAAASGAPDSGWPDCSCPATGRHKWPPPSSASHPRATFPPCRALFLIIGLPLNLVLLGLYLWYRAAGSPKRFAASLAGSAAAAALIVTLLLLHFQRLVRGWWHSWVMGACAKCRWELSCCVGKHTRGSLVCSPHRSAATSPPRPSPPAAGVCGLLRPLAGSGLRRQALPQRQRAQLRGAAHHPLG